MNAERNLPSARLDYMDAVRAFALLLGIVFHASLSFLPTFIGWAVMDISTTDVVSAFMLISHAFRMALFFLIAGFFSHMAFHRKGMPHFLRSRWVRIGVPFLVGWFLLRPLLVSGWVAGMQSMRGEVDIANALLQGVESYSELPNNLFVGTHLWFLYYLMVFTALLLMVRHVVLVHAPARALAHDLADKLVEWISRSSWGQLTSVLAIGGCLWFMQHWGIETPDKSLVPVLPVSILYGGFFSLGWLLHRQPDCLTGLGRMTLPRLMLCLGACGLAVFLSPYELQPVHPHYTLIKAAFIVSHAVMTWTLIGFSIGLCQRWFARPSRTVQYVSDASYWLYLVHLPIVIWLQIALAELHWHWSAKLASIVVVTLGVSLVMYEVLVRSSPIGQVLNGRKKPHIWRTARCNADGLNRPKI